MRRPSEDKASSIKVSVEESQQQTVFVFSAGGLQP